ncbi:MAG: hypothetical protein QXG98_03920 [Candidatus Micrarchaeia archaeon]
MPDVLRVIIDAFELWKNNWRKFITAYLVLFAIGLVFGAINFIIDLSQDALCSSEEPAMLLALCVFPQLISYALNVIEGFVSIIVMLAVIRPFYELSERKPPSDWADHFVPQLPNAIKVALLRFAIFLAAFIPLGIVVVLNLSALLALVASRIEGSAFLSVLPTAAPLSIVAATLFGILLHFIANFLLTFLEVEVVLSKVGVIQAAAASVTLVKQNLLDVFIFGLIWLGVNFGISVLSFMLCCTVVLIPLIFLIQPFILAPTYTLSTILLWKQLKPKSARTA